MGVVYNELDSYACAWLRNLVAAEAIAPGEIVEEDIQKLEPDLVRDAMQFHAFAGIGVWSYALRLAGWPDDVPVWTGSCPCQPFSVAGRRKGTKDVRHLWPDWLTLIEQCRPPVVFGEQVASPAGRVWLANVQTDLEALGYTFGAADLCAAGVGAPHIRQRLYFVGISDSLLPEQFERLWARPGEAEGLETYRELAGSGEAGGMAFAECSKRGPGELADERDREDARRDEAAGGARARREAGLVAFSHSDGSPVFEAARVHDQGAQRDDVVGCGGSGVLGDAQVGGGRAHEREPGQGRESQGQAGGPGVSDELGNADDEGLPPREREGLRGARGWEEGRAAVQPGSSPGTGGFWTDAEWLLCKDGKARPVEPGTFPLVDGTSPDMGSLRPGEVSPFRVIKDPKTGESIGQSPWRIGMLKGYGNAIVAQAAAVFIQTVKEALREVIQLSQE